jgi:polar amino acid transport system substrate-binding protein
METKTAKSFQHANPGLKVAALEDNTVSFSIAFPKDSELIEKVNQAIEKLQASGRLDEIRALWFTNYKTQSSAP